MWCVGNLLVGTAFEEAQAAEDEVVEDLEEEQVTF